MIDERSVTLDLDPAEEPTADDAVFYNTDMILNRDISIAAAQTYIDEQDRDLQLLDALAASGIRAFRYAKETTGIDQIRAVDKKPSAIENMEQNKELNDSTTVDIEHNDAIVHMVQEGGQYDIIDIDPFGSPVPFLDAAARAANHDAFIGITATDLGTLCGSYRKTCRRRYGTWMHKTSFQHEVGVRTLIKTVFEAFARNDMVFRPQLSFAQKHYYRLNGFVYESKKGVNRSLDNIGYIVICDDCSYRSMEPSVDETVCPYCETDLKRIGPTWIGHLGRKEFVTDTKDFCDDHDLDEAASLLDTLSNEIPIKTPYYDTHDLAATYNVPAPAIDDLLTAFESRGYTAVRSHFEHTGIRTNAPLDHIKTIIETI